jgi:hypothetical protein
VGLRPSGSESFYVCIKEAVVANYVSLGLYGVKLKSVSEDLLLSAERDDVRMTLPFLY